MAASRGRAHGGSGAYAKETHWAKNFSERMEFAG